MSDAFHLSFLNVTNKQCPSGECAYEGAREMSTILRRPPTGVCQVNKEPDRREMEPTVLQVGGMGVPVNRKADRAKREEADRSASID